MSFEFASAKIRVYWRIAIIFTLLSGGHVFAQDYTYGDGSANLYKITPGTLEYIPVQKEQSSSGSYSGGSPKSVRISKVDYARLAALLDGALAAKDAHTDKRVMMSGYILRHHHEAKTEAILAPGAPAKNQIELVLAALLNNKNDKNNRGQH